MPHELIIGRTQSGKTTLAIKKALAYRKKNTEVIVLDPLKNPDWPTDYIFTDQDSFLNVVFAKETRSCAVFIDESGRMIGRFGGVMNRLATEGRHWGHNCHFIAQRAQMIDVNVRANCAALNMFRTGAKDASVLAEEFACPELRNGNALLPGEFYYTDGFNVKKFNVFT